MSKIYADGGDKLTIGPKTAKISKIIINADGKEYSAGDDTGQTIRFDNPFGNEQMANALLANLRRYSYQPYSAEKLFLTPASELGDTIAIGGVVGGVNQVEKTYGRLLAANVKSPVKQDVVHEIKIKSRKQRVDERRYQQTQNSIGGLGGRIGNLKDDTESAFEHLTAAIAGGEIASDLSLYTAKTKENITAIAKLTAQIYDRESGGLKVALYEDLDNIASAEDRKKLKSAETTLYARVGQAEASLKLRVTEEQLKKTVAELTADFIKLKGFVTVEDGSLRLDKNLYCRKGISYLHKISAGEVSCTAFKYVKDNGVTTLTPKQITSTDGTVYTVLGA